MVNYITMVKHFTCTLHGYRSKDYDVKYFNSKNF